MKKYKPMLAKTATVPFSSKDWIFEVKWDGIRAISYVTDNISIESRNQKELNTVFPELHELKQLTKNVVLYGEIIVMKNGKVNFQTVIKRIQATSVREINNLKLKHPVLYILFDILEKDGVPLTNKPLIERKKILKETVKEGKNVLVSVFVEEKGEAYYQNTLKKGLEGVMAKKKNSGYIQVQGDGKIGFENKGFLGPICTSTWTFVVKMIRNFELCAGFFLKLLVKF